MPTQSRPPVQIPERTQDAHKGTFGRVLLIGGSRGMSGSISLSSVATLKTGSGLVTAAVPNRCLETVAAFHPCLMTIPLPDDDKGTFSVEASTSVATRLAKVDAVGAGPGMTTGAGSVRIVERLIAASGLPRVLDADAINVLAELAWASSATADHTGPLVLTPHPGELQRLVGVPAKHRTDQINAAEKLSDQTGAVIVVKGGPTVVVGLGQRYTNSTGNPGMATAGSGDVLTGVVTSLLGQGLSPWDAARLAVWIHGRAGDLAAKLTGQAGLTALEILQCLPQAVVDAQARSFPVDGA
ncbi:NAD(P)H-hydrate dehydratase [Rubripirellula reticaptiva]|uniref:ADP-dependent (S)-NAD(P)H-hydrate dehydratase n=1 Tax=Rubripirellula reticaptiva TaxID=2528013 RepID=A0A5C6FA80_9BACT|nr:NAD(P)H-hydrate dehydratase [Rubripirellula reticaptiva]TWU57324.1 ATP-dependent (S)-NAD(P)H-hydrate dehydratase [Rubripirellula reticaptiva]